MNKVKIILLILLLYSCSLDTKSGIWTNKSVLKEENENIKYVFKKKETGEKEYNLNLKIKLESKLVNSSSILSNNNNNAGRVNFNKEVKKISKYKFSKIKNFNYFEPEITFDGENFVFFDDKGNLIKFDQEPSVIWKKNFYNKREKKLKPIITLTNNGQTLVAVDNISKFYAINISNGELLWSKDNINPFNSQVKIHKDRFFVIDFDDILRCYSLKDGNEIWKLNNSTDIFLKSGKRNSLILVNDIVYFNNSIGDITAVNSKDGTIIWQTPTQSSRIFENAFSLVASDIVADNKDLIFSNNKKEFYSINLTNGFINWKKDISSSVRPVIINDLIFTFSNEGFLYILDKKSGKIIRITDTFDLWDAKDRSDIRPIGFVVGTDKIYLTTSNGRLLTIDISSGKTLSIFKIANDKISRPFILNKELLIVKENSIIHLN